MLAIIDVFLCVKKCDVLLHHVIENIYKLMFGSVFFVSAVVKGNNDPQPNNHACD
jgi:hypothetical protein